jgi:hypothetical protein
MRVLVEGLPSQTLLNVNVPREPPRGIRFARLGRRVYNGKVVEQVDPRGRTHYWLGGGPPQWEALAGTDMGAVHEGYVAVTPIHLDLTHHRALAQMGDWGSALDSQYRRETARPGMPGPAGLAPPVPARPAPASLEPARPVPARPVAASPGLARPAPARPAAAPRKKRSRRR